MIRSCAMDTLTNSKGQKIAVDPSLIIIPAERIPQLIGIAETARDLIAAHRAAGANVNAGFQVEPIAKRLGEQLDDLPVVESQTDPGDGGEELIVYPADKMSKLVGIVGIARDLIAAHRAAGANVNAGLQVESIAKRLGEKLDNFPFDMRRR